MNVVSTMPLRSQDGSSWLQWLEQIRASISASDALEQGPSFLYLMADSRANPNLNELLEQVPNLLWRSLWRDLDVEMYVDIAPYLIEIDFNALNDERSLHHRLIRRIWREGNDKYMLTWLWSPFSIDILDEHFRRYCTYRLPDKRAFYLHFYDNRILERLRKAWTAEEQQAFIQPCTKIWYDSRLEGEMVIWRNESAAMPPDNDTAIMLTLEQHQLLLDLGYPDKLALNLRESCGAILSHLTSLELYRLISIHIERAARYRIKSDDELRSYALYGVLSTPTFDEHPLVHERLLAVRRGEMTAVDALRGVSENDWREIRKGNNKL